MGRRAHVRLDDPLAPPRARLRRTHRLFRSHDPRRSRKPPAQANRSPIAVFKRTLRGKDKVRRDARGTLVLALALTAMAPSRARPDVRVFNFLDRCSECYVATAVDD